MHRLLMLAALILLVTSLAGCAQVQPQAATLQPPQVALDHVEVQAYFATPWANWPGPPPTPTAPAPGPVSVPIVLAFIWNITNPNPAPVTLERLQFTAAFEGPPGQYFDLNTPLTTDRQSIPANTTNQIRSIAIIDSATVAGNLAVTSGSRLKELNLTGTALIQKWWTEIGDFKFGIRARQGTAEFRDAQGKTTVVQFEDTFPKK